ncbi:hypothetical protein Taro_009111 [Colocasia esculenta]|uniref:Hexosyltransferase n=1 Tax=Colocasia esculenta TaxID=4460 RepID=A0A843U438_COLES|nr:hypothetical protein [Colocasia esculenta]
MEGSGTSAATRLRWNVLGAVLFLALCLGCFFVFFFDVEMSSSISQSIRLFGSAADPTPPALRGSPRHVELSVLVGVLTLPDRYDGRHRLRLVYRTQPTTLAEIDLKFVLCNLTTESQRVMVGLEILLYNDIIILNCTENMNDGKTYTYFSSLPSILPRRYDYVLKADDDTFFRLAPLAASLWPLPREELYYGFVIPCEKKEPLGGWYMSGMGYVLSWDLVEFIAKANITGQEKVGAEDQMLGWWLNKAHRGKNRYNMKPHMYDHPAVGGKCSHEFWPGTVAVHRLKTQDRWIDTLQYFNATRAIKPSILYHLD